jgi:hypothetical protein
MYVHILTLIFVVAKILGYVSWSWWLVFLPSIIGMTIGLTIIFLALLFASKL